MRILNPLRLPFRQGAFEYCVAESVTRGDPEAHAGGGPRLAFEGPAQYGQAVTLDQLDEGATGQIIDIVAERTFRRRLLELGLVPGTQIRVLRVAPLGDPMEFWARDAHWSMRRAEARNVQIEIVNAPTLPLPHLGTHSAAPDTGAPKSPRP